MAEISEYEERIAAALSRMRRGVETLANAAAAVVPPPAKADGEDAAPDQSDEIAALKARLDDEQMVNRQLEERLKGVKDRQDQIVSRLEAEVARLKGQFQSFDTDLERLRQTNADLRDMAARLRESIEDEVVDAEMVNRALKAELDALEATRAADRAEIEAILAELRPIIEEAN